MLTVTLRNSVIHCASCSFHHACNPCLVAPCGVVCSVNPLMQEHPTNPPAVDAITPECTPLSGPSLVCVCIHSGPGRWISFTKLCYCWELLAVWSWCIKCWRLLAVWSWCINWCAICAKMRVAAIIANTRLLLWKWQFAARNRLGAWGFMRSGLQRVG